MHVPQATWAAPKDTSTITPSSLALTEAKYSVQYDPSAAVANIFYAGHYSKVTWYQPKLAASYLLTRRYGKSNYVGAYCIYGSGSTGYADSPEAGVSLTGATAIAAGAIVLGSTLLAL